jgi:hypothetical protein
MEALLEQHPEWSGRVIMFLIVKERGLVDKVSFEPNRMYVHTRNNENKRNWLLWGSLWLEMWIVLSDTLTESLVPCRTCPSTTARECSRKLALRSRFYR